VNRTSHDNFEVYDAKPFTGMLVASDDRASGMPVERRAGLTLMDAFAKSL
jgi:hypothetical protein